MSQATLNMTRGEAHRWKMTGRDADGAPVDWSDFTSVTFYAKRHATDADGAAVFNLTIGNGITLQAAGLEAIIVTRPGDTSAFEDRPVRLMIKIRTVDGTGAPEEPITGTLTVAPA